MASTTHLEKNDTILRNLYLYKHPCITLSLKRKRKRFGRPLKLVSPLCFPVPATPLADFLPPLSYDQPKVSRSPPTHWAVLGAVLWQSVCTHTPSHHHMLRIIILIPLWVCLEISWTLPHCTPGRNVCVCECVHIYHPPPSFGKGLPGIYAWSNELFKQEHGRVKKSGGHSMLKNTLRSWRES